MKPDTTDETPKNRQARRALTALGRSSIVAPEWVSPQQVCMLLGISKSTFWRLRTFHNFPRGVRLGSLDMERIAVQKIREWVATQPGVDEISVARGRRGGARLVGQETQPGVTG
jgi:predicted DNA-binding transcriptional regulator AlpA